MSILSVKAIKVTDVRPFEMMLQETERLIKALMVFLAPPGGLAE